ncbi:MAG: SURF1 family protein [Alphaproteobacteria bacterium]|nr:SURF1 family protein [Alphaproteobacteria bacterium]NCQ67391.1 SURF1 family protein [Alphaproteobacteria bacterium]NCT06643.1 SURF1 family protein [Alphaproteobacteria bacterium]
MRTHSSKDIFSYLGYLVKPGLRGFFTFFLTTFILLIVLGTWQLRRLEWKNNLIQTINQNLAKPSVELDDLVTDTLSKGQTPDYRRVKITGTLENEKPFRVLSKTHKGQLGYHLIVPLSLSNGARLLVNLGWMPLDKGIKDINFPQSPITVSGIVKSAAERTAYTPENNYQTHDLFSLDPLEVAQEKTWPALLPFYIVRLSKGVFTQEYPVPLEGKIAITNSHLGYAVTWYLLALFWGLIFTFYARRHIHNEFMKT